MLNMRSFTSKSSLVLLGLLLLGSLGCGTDNEAAIREQARRAKGTIPGSRTAQAKTQEEYFEITPGIQGAGMSSGPRPDQGKGYPAPGVFRSGPGAPGSGARPGPAQKSPSVKK